MKFTTVLLATAMAVAPTVVWAQSSSATGRGAGSQEAAPGSGNFEGSSGRVLPPATDDMNGRSSATEGAAPPPPNSPYPPPASPYGREANPGGPGK